jgi:hypothetical protein
MVGLPAVLFVSVLLRELGFPESDPIVQWNFRPARRDKEMHVVGHYHVSANEPFVGLPPDRIQ